MRKEQRRYFLKKLVWGGASALLIAEACNTKESAIGPGAGPNGFNFGSGDIGLLNFAYMMAQLQAEFYSQLLNAKPEYLTDEESPLFNDIRKHEIAQREFLKTALGSNALPSLRFDFSSLNLTTRESGLSACILLEDLGVQALNGLVKYIQASAFSTIFGKMASVQARHSAYVRQINKDLSFTGTPVVDANSLEVAQKPVDILAKIHPAYIKTALDSGSLPNS